MSFPFHDKRLFNNDNSCWNVASCTNMNNMFYGASSFNQPLEGLDTSSVINMSSRAVSFNQHIEGLDTSSVTDMYR